jgi:SAM-dependent methyltransferase
VIVTSCRACGSPLDFRFVDLGQMPLANAYLSAEKLGQPEPRYPLRAMVCTTCFLVQLDVAVDPALLFCHYAYFSSTASSWVGHARAFVELAISRLGLGPSSQVVEVASNDGYLLQHFVARGIPVLGIEPAQNVAQVAAQRGIPTESRFFGAALADDLVSRGRAADLVIANNVLAHVPDVQDFASGLRQLLKPDGVLTVEFPHLVSLIRNVQFDTIYHEHYSYLSLYAVEAIFSRQGIEVFDVEEQPTHGGSLRVWAHRRDGPARNRGSGLEACRALERAQHIHQPAGYEGFQAKVERVRDELRRYLAQAKRGGRRVAGYGAAAKGNTLLNFAGVTTADIEFVADRSEHKQGLYLPGSHVPVVAPERVREARPDDLLILAWNLRDEIRESMAFIRDWGGRFLVPIPSIEVLG